MALIDKILDQFNITDCSPISTPLKSGLILSYYSDVALFAEQEIELLDLPYHWLVGLLMYLTITTCLDIAFAVGKLS